MSNYSYVTFDISPHRRVLDHGDVLLEEFNRILSITIFPGVTPSYKVIKDKVFTIKKMIRDYLSELDSVTGQDTYLTEFDAPKDGYYVGYSGVIQITEDVEAMRRIYKRLLKLAVRGRRTTMPYVALAIRKYVRINLLASRQR